MKEKSKQRETWVIVASIATYLATAAATIYGGLTDSALPIETVAPLFTAALSGLGIGGATQIKRAAQRGEAAGKALAPAAQPVRSAIADVQDYWGGATYEAQQSPVATQGVAQTQVQPVSERAGTDSAFQPAPRTGPRAEQEGDN